MVKRLKNDEFKEYVNKISKTHKFVTGCTEVDKKTNHKTKTYIFRRKTQTEKYDDIMNMKPFKEFN